LKNLDVVGRVTAPLFVSMFYSDARNATNVSATPVFGDITLENIVVHDAQPTGKDGWCGKTDGRFQTF
jgi:hypothetical protein